MQGPGSCAFSRNQIDKLGERLKSGVNVSTEDLALLASFQFSLLPLHDRAREEVGLFFREVLPDEPYEPTSRVKQLRSIVAKLRRMSTRLSSIQDLVGFRVVVPNAQSQQELVERLAKLEDCRIVDRRNQSMHGYRAVHVIRRDGFRSIEIQVRTLLQHYWAEWSERADRVIPGVKYGDASEKAPDLQEVLLTLSRAIQSEESVEMDFVAFDRGQEPRAEYELLRSELDRIRRTMIEHIESALQLVPREADQ